MINKYKKKIIYRIKSNKKSTTNIQYILKQYVYPILIPRNDTENINLLVKYINYYKTIVDLGSGSGNILSNIKNKKSIMIDLNYLAILSTRRYEINFCYEIKYFLNTNLQYDVILSNPPYLCSKHIILYMVIKKKNALYANFKGLEYFLSLIKYSYKIFLNTPEQCI